MSRSPNRRLSDKVAYYLDNDKKLAAKVLSAVFSTIKAALQRGESVYVKGFGTFKVVERTPKRTSKFFLGHDGQDNIVSETIIQHPPRHYAIFEPAIPFMAMMNLDTPNYKERRSQRTWRTS